MFQISILVISNKNFCHCHGNLFILNCRKHGYKDEHIYRYRSNKKEDISDKDFEQNNIITTEEYLKITYKINNKNQENIKNKNKVKSYCHDLIFFEFVKGTLSVLDQSFRLFSKEIQEQSHNIKLDIIKKEVIHIIFMKFTKKD